MAFRKRYRRLQGSSAYYPFGLRIALRRRQRSRARVLRLLGSLALLAAAALVLRQTVFRGGQPEPPAAEGEQEPPREAPPAEGREIIPLSQQKARFTDDELAILAALKGRSLSADEVVERTQIPARYVLSALTMLQVQGAVEEGAGRRFRALVELEE